MPVRFHAFEFGEHSMSFSLSKNTRRDRCSSSHAGKIATIMSISLSLISCASPVFHSGEELSTEERSELRAGRGINFLRIDGDTVDGRWLIMKPGDYTLEFTSKRDVKAFNSALTGVVDELECTIKVEVLASEEVYLSSRLKTGPPRFSGGYSTSSFHTEVALDSSVEGRSRSIDTSRCAHRIDCRKVDRTRVMPPNCS